MSFNFCYLIKRRLSFTRCYLNFTYLGKINYFQAQSPSPKALLPYYIIVYRQDLQFSLLSQMPFSYCLFGAIIVNTNLQQFVVLISGFFVTNLPRILLDLHEILVFENALACGKAGFQ